MKGNLLKSFVFVLVLGLGINVFALSGTILKPKANDKSIKKDIVTKEIVIDDIEKMNVPVYEYVEKVIIEGPLKWYTQKPYEFGKDIEELDGGEFNFTYPDSLAVDSKGNIYILDTVDNRIQKYDKDGKYIKSIPVESFEPGFPPGYTIEQWKKERENSLDSVPAFGGAVEGVNIVIDSKDNLYYYMVRNPKTKNAKGEVWMFKNDKLVKKWKGLPRGYLYYDNDIDKILIRTKIKESEGYPVFKIYDFIDNKIVGEKNFHKIDNEKDKILIKDKNYENKVVKAQIKNNLEIINLKRKGLSLKLNNKGKYELFLPIINNFTKDLAFMIPTSKAIIIDFNGKIKGIYPLRPKTQYSYWPFGLPMDKNRNVYEMITDDDSGKLKVYKYELKRIK